MQALRATLQRACTAPHGIAVQSPMKALGKPDSRAMLRRSERTRAAAAGDADKLAALQQAMAQNPELQARMQQMEEAMANPAVQQQMSQMAAVMNNPQFMQKMAELREDPELKDIFEEIKKGGMAAMMKYMNDPEFLAKIGSKMGDLDPSLVAGPAAAAPPPEPVVNNVLDAAKYGDLEAVEDYCAIGKGGMTDEEGRGALHYAVAYNQLAAVQALISNGAQLSATDNTGSTAVHYAAGYGRAECLKALLAAGADASVKNERGQSAADVVRQEPRNPLNQDEALLAVLDGKQPASSLA